ncbi:MAG: FxsA family protein [Jannaschia helgolandensis]
MWLLAIFIVVPIIEIALFIQVGGWLGLWPTLAIVVLTAILGTTLVKRQGLAALAQVQASLNELTDPTRALAHGAMILASGLLLLTPGFFTDAIGFALLIPAVRDFVMRQVRARINVQSFSVGTDLHSRSTTADNDVVEGDYVEVPRRDGPSGWTRE